MSRRSLRFNDRCLFELSTDQKQPFRPDLKKRPSKRILSATEKNASLLRRRVRNSEFAQNNALSNMRKGSILYKFNNKT